MIKIMKRVRSRPHFVANYLCRLHDQNRKLKSSMRKARKEISKVKEEIERLLAMVTDARNDAWDKGQKIKELEEDIRVKDVEIKRLEDDVRFESSSLSSDGENSNAGWLP